MPLFTAIFIGALSTLAAPSEEVIAQIQKLQEAPSYDSAYFYNLAVLQLKSGKEDLSFAYAMKAARLKSHDTEVRALTRYTEQLWRKNHAGLDPNLAATSTERFSDRMAAEEIYGILALTTFLVSFFWARAYIRHRSIRRALLRPAGWIGAIALAFAYILYGIYFVGSADASATVVVTYDARSGPGQSFSKVQEVPTGQIIRRVSIPVTTGSERSPESWQAFRLPNGESAWIPESCLLPL
jgi:hypothetical protein